MKIVAQRYEEVVIEHTDEEHELAFAQVPPTQWQITRSGPRVVGGCRVKGNLIIARRYIGKPERRKVNK